MLSLTRGKKSLRKKNTPGIYFFHYRKYFDTLWSSSRCSHVTINLVECKEFDYQDYVKFRQNYNLSWDILIQFVHSSDYLQIRPRVASHLCHRLTWSAMEWPCLCTLSVYPVVVCSVQVFPVSSRWGAQGTTELLLVELLQDWPAQGPHWSAGSSKWGNIHHVLTHLGASNT